MTSVRESEPESFLLTVWGIIAVLVIGAVIIIAILNVRAGELQRNQNIRSCITKFANVTDVVACKQLLK